MVHHFPNGREVPSMAAGNSLTHQVQPIQRGRPAHHATITTVNKANAENNPPSISKHTGRGSVPFLQDISVCRSTPHKPPRRRANDTHHLLPHRSRRPTLRCTGGTTRHGYPYLLRALQVQSEIRHRHRVETARPHGGNRQHERFDSSATTTHKKKSRQGVEEAYSTTGLADIKPPDTTERSRKLNMCPFRDANKCSETYDRCHLQIKIRSRQVLAVLVPTL